MKQEQRGEERRKEGKLKERREEEMEETGGNKTREAQDKTRETEVQPLSVSLQTFVTKTQAEKCHVFVSSGI